MNRPLRSSQPSSLQSLQFPAGFKNVLNAHPILPPSSPSHQPSSRRSVITIVSPRLNESPLSLCATQSCSATTFIGSGGSAAFTDGAGGGFVPPAIDTLRLSGLAPFMISSAVDPRSIEAAGVPRLATEPEGVRGSATEPASSMNEKRERTARACLEYSVYLAALPPACWALGLSSCMFPLEGLVFNAPMVFLAWRFARTPERGQAHARRLFLASLAYLPLFFGCLLLHQRRKAPAAAEEEADAPLALATADVGEEEITAAYAAKQAELKARGREYCVHEHPELTGELQPSAPLRVLMGVGLALCPNPPLGGADAAQQQQQPAQR